MVDGVRAIHDRGIATGLVSNSWGTRRYPRDLLAELFDGIVISGEEGFRKPDPRMYELGAQRIGADPSACVFVDDLAFNLDPARELGMAVVHHTAAALDAGGARGAAHRLIAVRAAPALRGANSSADGRPAAPAAPSCWIGVAARHSSSTVLTFGARSPTIQHPPG